MATRLGMGKRQLEPLISAPYQEAKRMLATMKEQLKAKYKQAAFELHPDRNQGNTAKAAEQFKLMVRVKAILEEIRVEPPRQPMPAYGIPTHQNCRSTVADVMPDIATIIDEMQRTMDAAFREAGHVREKAERVRRGAAAAKTNADAKTKEGRVKANAARVKARVDGEAKISRPTEVETKKHGTPGEVFGFGSGRADTTRPGVGYTGSGISWMTHNYKE